LQIGRPAQQCTGRSLVKVGGTYVARALGQYRIKPLKLGEGAETGSRAPLADLWVMHQMEEWNSTLGQEGIGEL